MTRAFAERTGSAITYYQEVSAGTFLPFIPPAGMVKTPASFPVPRPVDKSYPSANGSFDLSFYPVLPKRPGFPLFVDFMRRTDVPLADTFRQADLVMNLGLTEVEAADPSLRSKIYVEIGGGQLNHPQKGDLQHHAEFVKASVGEVVTALDSQFSANWVGVNRIGFNFETTYAPDVAYSTLSGAQTFLGGDVTLVCECPSLKGQSKTISQLWSAGKFQEEIGQRMVNRHVALVLYVKGRAGASTLVANSDGTVCYYLGDPHNDDYFAERDNLTGSPSYNAYWWDTPSNFDSVNAGGVNVASQNRKLWDVQDWMNMYKYPQRGILSPSDYDTLLGGASGYAALWDKLSPSAEWYDLAINALFDINQRKLAAMGRTIPVSFQTHYRYEGGIQRGSNYDAVSKNFGLDEAVCAPWHNNTVGVLAFMCAKNPNSNVTNWRTTKQWPNPIWNNNINSGRPHGDGLAFRAAKAMMVKFGEYWDPANSPQVIYRNFVKPAVGTGSYGQAVTSGGDGYYRRSPKDVGHPANSEDVRSKINVITRVITKNGAKWALIAASNWRQGKTQTSEFSLRFRPADVPGLTAQKDITSLSFTGWEPYVAEVCLEPEKLGTISTGGSTAPSGSVPFEPVNTNASSWGSSDMIYLENSYIKAGFRKSVGALLCHLQNKADGIGLVNDCKITHNGVYESDKGRQAGDSGYGTPNGIPGPGFIQNGYHTSSISNDTGFNPVQGGNRATTPDPDHVWNIGSPVVIFERRDSVPGKGTVLYTAVTPLHWSIPSSAGVSQLRFETWWWLEGRALRRYSRITNNRTDTQRVYESREQEYPFLYATAPYYRHFVYIGDSPYTGGSLTEITLADPAVGGEQHGQPKLTAEPFIMALESTATKGVGVWRPDNNRYINKGFVSRSGDEDSNDSSYINAAPVADMDNNYVYEYESGFIVGTATEIRAWVSDHQSTPVFDFTFAGNPSRWWNVNGAMRLTSGKLRINFAQPNNDGSKVQGKFGSPFQAWPASMLGTIYIKGTFKGVTQMALGFTKTGTDNGSLTGKKTFFVIGDGIERVYAVTMAGTSGFSGIITSIQVCHADGTTNSDLGSDVWFEPSRISNQSIS